MIFKPTFRNKDGKVKGNCDAELVLQAMIELNKYDNAVIVTGDGDFSCLIKYLREQNKLAKVICPNSNYSGLLKKASAGFITTLTDLQKKLEFITR